MPIRLGSNVTVALGFLSATAFFSPAYSAKLTPADMRWIDTCIAIRKAEAISQSSLRKYCTCMQEIVDDNEPFENATALERTYPPAHRTCRRQAGIR
jgi:hypothetical protein